MIKGNVLCQNKLYMVSQKKLSKKYFIKCDYRIDKVKQKYFFFFFTFHEWNKFNYVVQ
jgi:hypothetical protein